jgi:hypothetical protein
MLLVFTLPIYAAAAAAAATAATAAALRSPGALPNKCKAMLNRNAGLDTDSTSPDSKSVQTWPFTYTKILQWLSLAGMYDGCGNPLWE